MRSLVPHGAARSDLEEGTCQNYKPGMQILHAQSGHVNYLAAKNGLLFLLSVFEIQLSC